MLYVFVGSRDQRLREAVLVALGHPAGDELGYTHLDGKQASVDDLAAACGTLSMFGDRRKVFFENAQLHTGRRAKLTEWLRAFARDPALLAACDLAVAVYLDLGDRRARDRARAFVGLEKVGAQVREFRPLTVADAIRFIQHRARDQGVAITADAAARLAEMVTTDAGILASEVDKLAAYIGFSGTVDLDAVDAASATIGEHARWDYIDAVRDRRLDRALRVLHDMLDLKAPHPLILSSITTSLREMVNAKRELAGGGDAGSLARSTGLPPRVVQQRVRQAAQVSDRLLTRLYAEVARTDLALKSTGGDPDALLEILTARVAARPVRRA